ncbi:hypothetical protein [Flavobacterium coralii]|uniref:hypothetical protein n=1 Tax=Flavobacterium coralii TaxID=2838017 RepID=UPI000C46595B|nr:hypothetical protein [Flavobacterium sp.]|tara:strand:- start:509 stop:796 length:288 start_codon:yes stop_codon:yes gene_type:complete
MKNDELTELVGYIGSIEFEPAKNNLHFDKYVVCLKRKYRQSSYIDFRSRAIMNEIQKFKEGDLVSIMVRHESHTSKSSGIRYNNIVAKEITLIKE